MKPINLLTAIVVGCGLPLAQAMADCSTDQVTDFSIFAGKTLSFNCQNACDSWMAATSTDWHEVHNAGGSLEEIGTGASGLQPQAVVGTWMELTSTDEIQYTYTGDGSYTYSVYQTSGTLGDSGSAYDFCTGGTAKANGTID
jgi:hypothetical protein